jgi:hypothetical protein
MFCYGYKDSPRARETLWRHFRVKKMDIMSMVIGYINGQKRLTHSLVLIAAYPVFSATVKINAKYSL